MKRVLVIDAHGIFKDFIRNKLVADKIEVQEVYGRREAFSKLASELPDLIIIDTHETTLELIDFLRIKQENPNAKKIPVIVLGIEISTDKLRPLAQLNVVKYFSRPIKFDLLLDVLHKILQTDFLLDTTPCAIDIHLNNDIIFIEIADGLNYDKIVLLRFKITEIIDANGLIAPKIAVTLAGFEFSFIDGYNLELLFDSLIADKRVAKGSIKIISPDPFIRQLVAGHPQYNGIEAVPQLSDAFPFLAGDAAGAEGILSASENANAGSVEMRFRTEISAGEESPLVNAKVAVVDDEPQAVQSIAEAFQNAGAVVSRYTDGQTFLDSNTEFDVVILDVVMPRVTGLDVLKALLTRRCSSNVLVYSKLTRRDVVLQVMTLGAKGYMVKPQEPDAVLQKAIETFGPLGGTMVVRRGSG
jgi:DNA-binding NarL/FixJ family response regulator